VSLTQTYDAGSVGCVSKRRAAVSDISGKLRRETPHVLSFCVANRSSVRTARIASAFFVRSNATARSSAFALRTRPLVGHDKRPSYCC
jgi:hypothetical protein